MSAVTTTLAMTGQRAGIDPDISFARTSEPPISAVVSSAPMYIPKRLLLPVAHAVARRPLSTAAAPKLAINWLELKARAARPARMATASTGVC
jgi:hypothetical protein